MKKDVGIRSELRHFYYEHEKIKHIFAYDPSNRRVYEVFKSMGKANYRPISPFELPKPVLDSMPYWKDRKWNQ